MSLTNAMNSGVSGLSAEGEALGVVGDNIANVNTVGFKQSRAVFEDVLGGAIGANTPGSGVRMVRAQQIFAQGSLSNTGQPTDLALSGDGFFVVKGSVDGVTGDFYSRDGQTTLRADGTLVNHDGLALQGYTANADGSYSSTVGSVQVPTAALPPKATTEFTATANLDSTSTTPTLPWDPQNPGATSNFSTATTTYDSLGSAHQVTVYYRKTGAGTWDTHAIASGSEVAGGTAGTNVDIGDGTLTFDSTGALQSTTGTGATVSWNGATAGQAIAFHFGTPTSAGGTGRDGITQFGSASNVSSQSQDGYASGSLSGVNVDDSGVVSGVYSNGQQVAVAQLAVAKFRSNDGLGRAGHNLWEATQTSGDPTLGAAGSGGRGTVVSGALEQSNVDIASQFVELISHQRSFEANSKTITTADQMIQELMTIKQ